MHLAKQLEHPQHEACAVGAGPGLLAPSGTPLAQLHQEALIKAQLECLLPLLLGSTHVKDLHEGMYTYTYMHTCAYLCLYVCYSAARTKDLHEGMYLCM